MITEDNYDEINRMLQAIFLESFKYSELSPRLYIASGEDFDIEMAWGAPNRLLSDNYGQPTD